jgi:thiamine monophosphate kinase
MTDISDGLATEAKHLAVASNKKFVINSYALRNTSSDPLDFRSIFSDGEDFELLFTCSPAVADSLSKDFAWPCGLRKIGRVSQGEGVFICESDDKAPSPLEFSGYEH